MGVLSMSTPAQQCNHPSDQRYRSVKAKTGETFCLNCRQILPALSRALEKLLIRRFYK
jgi:hypothetical protein